ncbi:SNF2 family N-terminal domain-containing protein [Hypoxylon sp. FL0890]|nr:SNF2 family N-terminal domain-containing protein [Hypoxylon sp. FL0890]
MIGRMSAAPGRGSASIPGTSGLSRNGQPGGRTLNSKAAYLETEDDDLDELANDDIPCSSPFFTQPTQIINKSTQPTQILNRTTLRQPSSPLVPSTPSTVIEVPASSPFQAKSQARPSVVLDKKPGVASRVGSLMAPAGTSFRPPAMQKPSHSAKGSDGRRGYLDISDDDLLEDYKKRDSSDDDTPARGDIRPSTFAKKEKTPPSLSKAAAKWLQEKDISLNDIRDVRLRHLTSQVYKAVQRAVPGVTVRACMDALRKDVNWQVSKAVDFLTGRSMKSLPSSRATSASKIYANGTTGDSQGPEDSISISTTLSAGHSAPPRNTLQSFLKKAPSAANSSGPSSQSSTQLSRTQSSTNSTNSTNSPNTNNNPPRRRLVQGRRNQSATPSAIFSVSSSPTSSLTSLTNSREPSPNSLTMKGTAVPKAPEPEEMPRPRRRLMQGRRNITPPPITIPSDSEEEPTLTPPKPTESRKRQANAEIARITKKTKTDIVGVLSDAKSVCSKKRKAEDEPIHEILEDSDQEDYEDDSPESISEQLANVLEYLNTCTVEALGRMIGSNPDAKLMVSARPFRSISAAEKVSRMDKGKSKTKTRKVAVGETIVEKLTSWMEACEAASAVISECEKRGKKINSIISTWSVDKNGNPRTDAEGLMELPIKEQPKFMSESISMKDYQLLGLNWMDLLHRKGYSGILADDMGLGKTCQVISFIAHLVGSKRQPGARAPWPNLIVVPPSTYENWLSEFEKFAPEIKVLPYSGKSRRDILPKDARKHHVVLTTYPQVERQREDLRWLQKIDPYAAIFDEGHRLKNQDTLIYRQMMQVPTEWRLILSGTPVQNNLKELLTLLRFIEPSLFEETSFETLNTIFEAKVTSKDVLNFAALASERVDRARAVMAPFILQRRKEDVIALKKKTERLELVGMHKTQKEIYDSIKGRYLLPNGVKAKEAHPWMQLRKAAIHHQLFRHHFTDAKVNEMVDILWKNCSEDELCVQNKEDRYKDRLREEFMSKSDFQLHLWCKDFEKYIGHLDIPDRSWEDSPKVQKLLELVRGYMKTGDRVLVFSRFEMVIDILRETLHHAGIKYCCLTGAMETSTRFPECQKFTNNTDIPVFLLTTGAGGTGLNLVAANKIILFDQSDNPQEDVQASNRAHRIGQTRDVEVIRLITEKSVEGLIYNSCVKKLVLAARVERQFDAVDEEEESVEDQCKRLMLLGDEVELAEVAPSTQQV